MRTLSFSWSWWKWKSRSRAALTSCTGTFTSPKLSDPDQSARAISAAALRAEAGLECRRQVVAVVGFLLGGQVNLLARGFVLDQRKDRLAIGVVVAVGLEVLVERIEQPAR